MSYINTLRNKLTLASCLILSSMICTIANASDKEEFLQVKGKASSVNHSRIENYILNVYEGNRLVESIEVKRGFKLQLRDNIEYTLELMKEGYYSKRISINTKCRREVEDVEKHEIEFEAILFPVEANPNDYYFDFPATLIRFDPSEEFLQINEKYTKFIQQKMRQG
jgi:hypothetical protein